MSAGCRFVMCLAAGLLFLLPGAARPAAAAGDQDVRACQERAKEEKQNLEQDVAIARKSEAKERAAREQIEKQLAAATARVQQLEKEKADRERTASAEKQNLLQDQAVARKSEEKERA